MSTTIPSGGRFSFPGLNCINAKKGVHLFISTTLMLFISPFFSLFLALSFYIPPFFFFYHSLYPLNSQHSSTLLNLYSFTAMTDYNTDYSKQSEAKGKKGQKKKKKKNLLSMGMNLCLDALLMAACKDDNLDILEKVLAADASAIDINHTDEAGNTALHYA